MSDKYRDSDYAITADGRLLVSTAKLTQKLNTTKQSLSVWVKKGCPREKPGWYDLFAVIEWRNATNAGDPVSEADKLRADVRLKEARIELANIEIQVKNAELVPISMVKDYLQTAFTDLKNNMLAIGDRVMTDVYSQYRLSFIMLTDMPAVIVEPGFIDNDNDLKVILDNKEAIGVAIADGIMEYLLGG